MFFPIILSVLILFLIISATSIIMKKNIHIWLTSYIFNIFYSVYKRKKVNNNKPIHLYFCFVDHFEPKWQNAPIEKQINRVDTWCRDYRKLASKHKDSNGNFPQHTFFYPEEEYEYEYLDKLAELCKEGYGDVEIHLHHQDDTPEQLKIKLINFKETLYKKHKLLRKDKTNGEIQYCFIHGMWALDNSRKDGKWCGINNELTILKETGCCSDFTLPSAPSDTQTKKINSIYYAFDDPNKPKSHNTGINVKVGIKTIADLMIIQGPLTLNWKNRKFGIFPRIENGEISNMNPFSRERVDLWVKQHICVEDNYNNIFVKVHTHGAQEGDFNALLGKPMDDLFNYLESKYNDGKNYVLHYVTAWELYNIVKKIEIGEI